MKSAFRLDDEDIIRMSRVGGGIPPARFVDVCVHGAEGDDGLAVVYSRRYHRAVASRALTRPESSTP